MSIKVENNKIKIVHDGKQVAIGWNYKTPSGKKFMIKIDPGYIEIVKVEYPNIITHHEYIHCETEQNGIEVIKQLIKIINRKR
ncbi:MAG: hypothetical protein PHG08_01035 [Bacilli bacterium]|nr:hypothetical protein [Bacilli bacterium]